VSVSIILRRCSSVTAERSVACRGKAVPGRTPGRLCQAKRIRPYPRHRRNAGSQTRSSLTT